ncbi:MAG: hypothetical protein AAGN82_16330 [Myxococcota bacterium]
MKATSTTLDAASATVVALGVFIALATWPGLARAERDNPCHPRDHGFGPYERWRALPSGGHVLLPQRGGTTRRGGVDLLVHFHGRDPIRKALAPLGRGVVIAAIDLGVSSAPYHRRFARPEVFRRMLEEVRAAMRDHHGRRDLYLRRIGLSSWSAGFGATAQILRQPLGEKIDAVVLLDSLYGSFRDPKRRRGLKQERLRPFAAFARRAAAGDRFFFQSHSQVPTPDYASTRETSLWVLGEVGGRLRAADRKERLGLHLIERYDRGAYRVRGYAGRDKPAHCGHLGLIRGVVGELLTRRRWRTPAARVRAR